VKRTALMLVSALCVIAGVQTAAAQDK